MPLYTFYPCKSDGSSDSFVSMELKDDAEAEARALAVLDAHASAIAVVAWQGERKAFTKERARPDLTAASRHH